MAAETSFVPNAPSGQSLNFLNLWTVVFGIMITESLLVTLLIIPLPVKLRRSMLQKWAAAWNCNQGIRVAIKTVVAIIGALFLDSLRRMYAAYGISKASMLHPDLLVTLEYMEAQRNAFVCGCTLFLFIVLDMFKAMTDEIGGLEKQLTSVHTQRKANELGTADTRQKKEFFLANVKGERVAAASIASHERPKVKKELLNERSTTCSNPHSRLTLDL